MRPNTIEDVLRKQPFHPFSIIYDGTPVRVDHPEQALFSGDRAVLVVAVPDGHIHLLDVDHIKAITLAPRRRKTTA